MSRNMSRKEDIKELISKHNRRLQKLKEKEAIAGHSIDPKVLIEIEDIETVIEKLQTKLQALENSGLDKESPGVWPELAENIKLKQRIQIYLIEKVIFEESGRVEEWVIKERKFDLVTFTYPTISSGIYRKSQRIKPGIEQNNQSQVPTKMNVPLSFEDLVIDGSLPPVKIKVKRTKKRKLSTSDDELLTELQCEV